MNNDLILSENIFPQIQTDSFQDLIEKITENLITSGDVNENFISGVLTREKNFPTGLPTEPFAIAIPHGDSINVVKNRIVIATLQDPLQMNLMGGGEEDTLSVKIVFLLALGESNKHLNILQLLMKAFKDESVLENIYSSDREGIINIMNKLI